MASTSENKVRFKYGRGSDYLHAQNLGISITSKNENAGAVAGVLCGGGTIEKCVAGLSVGTGNSISVTKGAGGIVGRVLVSGTVSYCQNLTAITGGGNCGGIAGIAYYTETNKKITIDHCTNYAKVTSTAGYVGGITGLSSGFIENCVNAGDVSSQADSTGGIVGEQKAYGEVKSCKNFGSVGSSGTGDKYGIGGIVGWIRYDDAKDDSGNKNYPVQALIHVSDCVNYGSVISTANCAGGIIGMTYTWAYINGNTNLAEKIKAVTFASGITSYQTTVSYEHGQTGITIVDNVSTTTGLEAGCTDGIIYTNGNQVESHNNVGTLPAGFIKETKPTPYIVSRSQTPAITINASEADPEIGDEVTLTADIANMKSGITYTYLWTPSKAETSSIVITTGGQYTVTVTVSDGIRTFSGTGECKIEYTSAVVDDDNGTTTTTTEETKVEEIDGKETEISVTTVVETKNETVVKAEAKATVTVEDSEGTVEVSDEMIQATVNTVVAADKTGQASKTISVTSENATEISISSEAISTISESGVALEFVSSEGTLTADADVVKTLASQDDKLTISFVKADDVVLPDTQQKVEDPTAYRLTVTKQDGTTVHKLKGTVDLTVKYDLPSNVAAAEVLVIYVDDNGKMEAMATTYDSDTGILKFSTDHFSYFMVGTKSMMSTTPTIIPDDDDYDYIPPYVAPTNTDNNDDDSKKMLACAAAAVVAALMAAFLVIDRKR